MPVLSIIIPVYSVEKYLRKCLDSVIDPSLGNYEIICVNDGSTDSSPQILEEYRARHPQLMRVITTPNSGPGAASNTGIASAEGEFITFLDSDDSYAPHALPELLAECRHEYDISIFDFSCISESGRLLSTIHGCNREEGSFTLEEYPQLLFEMPSRANKIFKRSLFTDHQIFFPTHVWFEDYRTTPKLYIHAEKIRYIRKVWYNYLQQSSSITHGKNAEKNLEIIAASEDLLTYYREAGLFDKYRSELEYTVYYNELLTSTDRVNLIDRNSPVQEKLLAWFLENFPNYRENPYFSTMSRQYKMLHTLIEHRQYLALNLMLRANNVIKRK